MVIRIGLTVLTCVFGFYFCGEGTIYSAEQGTLKVEIRDSPTGRPVTARVYLEDTGGTPHTPSGAISYKKGPEDHFIVREQFSAMLSPGRYRIRTERGPEYRHHLSEVEIAAGRTVRLAITLQRWIDMNRLGWFSGDLHNHRKADEMPALLAAEDLNLAPTLTDWVWEDRHRSVPASYDEPIRQLDGRRAFSILDKEVERLESGPGAVALLGLTRRISFDGYRLFPPDDVYCRQAREQGGYVDAEKIMWRDAAALVALGHVDFVGIVHNHFNRHGVELETDRWGMVPKYRPEFNTPEGMPLWSMDIYYRLLNCGFRLPVSGGSASGVKASPLGYDRVYAQLRDPFTYHRWFESLKAGRSFATNGPMLFFTVGDSLPGSTVRVTGKSRPLKIRARARSAGLLDRIEVINNGNVIRSSSGPAADGSLTLEFELRPDLTGWLAARCFERLDRTIRFAHTSPIFIDAGKPMETPAQDVQFFLDWMDREVNFYRREPGFRTPEHRAAMIDFFNRARAVFARLKGE